MTKIERIENTRDNNKVIVKEGHKLASEKNPPGNWFIPTIIRMEKRRKMATPIPRGIVIFKFIDWNIDVISKVEFSEGTIRRMSK
jgi:hypothetical protein